MNIVLTGASGALGKAFSEQFLAQGWTVYGTHFRSDPQAPIHAEKGKFEWIPMDLADAQSVHDGVKTVIASAGKIDALVHCAGGFRYATLDQTLTEDMEFLINSNLKSSFFIAREILPEMQKRNFGRVVFVGAKVAENPSAGMSVYAATKAGLIAFAKALADEMKLTGIRFKTLLPTVIDTPLNRRDMPTADFSKWDSPLDLAKTVMTFITAKE